MKKLILIPSIIFGVSLAGYFMLGSITRASDEPGNDKAITSISPGAINVTNPSSNNSDDYTYITPSLEYDNNESNLVNEDDNMTDSDITPWEPATEIDLEPTSITVLVNKEHALPKNYVPKNMLVPSIPFDVVHFEEKMLLRPEAAKAIEELFAEANQYGVELYGVSGYRSYQRQYKIFTNNIVTKGKSHTLLYSAVPGTSEHQTGLAMDVSLKSMKFKLINQFSSTTEGKWLEANAHRHGFIIRYPKDKTNITGYAYEPWHIRYVGKDLANYLFENDLTLEEYYNYTPSSEFNFELVYANLINYKPPKPTKVPEPEEPEELEEDLEELEENEDNLEENSDDELEDNPDDSDEDEDTSDEDEDTSDEDEDDKKKKDGDKKKKDKENSTNPDENETPDDENEISPTPSPKPKVSPTPTPSPSISPTPTPSVTSTITPTPTASPTPTKHHSEQSDSSNSMDGMED